MKYIVLVGLLLGFTLNIEATADRGKDKQRKEDQNILKGIYPLDRDNDDRNVYVYSPCAADGFSPTNHLLWTNKNMFSSWTTNGPFFAAVHSVLNNKESIQRTYTIDEINKDFVENIQNPSFKDIFFLPPYSGVPYDKTEIEFLKDALNITYKKDLVIVEQLIVAKVYYNNIKKPMETNHMYVIHMYEPDHMLRIVYRSDQPFNELYNRFINRTHLRFWAEQYAMSRYLEQSDLYEDSSVFSLLPKAFVYHSNLRLQSSSHNENGEEVHLFKNPKTGTTLILKTINKETNTSSLTKEDLKNKLDQRSGMGEFKERVQLESFVTESFNNKKVHYIYNFFHYEDKKRKWPRLKNQSAEQKQTDKKYKGRTLRDEILIVSDHQETYMIIEAQNENLIYKDIGSIQRPGLDGSGGGYINSIMIYTGHDYALDKLKESAELFDFLKDGAKDYDKMVAACERGVARTSVNLLYKENERYYLPTRGWYKKVLDGEISVEEIYRLRYSRY